MSVVLNESKIRSIINEEIERFLIEEGIFDDVKSGIVRLQKSVKAKAGSTLSKIVSQLNEKIGKLELPDDVKEIVDDLKKAMSETGESVKLDETLMSAKKLGKLTVSDALKIADDDFASGVKEYAKKLQETNFTAGLIITESEQARLDEFAVTGAVGIGLAVLGGLPMLFSMLKKVASFVKAKKLAHLFEHAEHVTHAFEVKTINAVIPNKLSYMTYKAMHNRGLKFANEKTKLLSYDEYVYDADDSDAMHRVNGLIYKALLIYFAFNGIASVLHAGASLVGVVEGAATTVKGVELARGAMEIAALASKTT